MRLLHVDYTTGRCLALDRVGNVYWIRRMTINEVQVRVLRATTPVVADEGRRQGLFGIV